MIESKSIKQFKKDLITTMPYFPNTKEVKEDLLSQHISTIIFHYLHWASRFIPERTRKVTVEPYLIMDPRWPKYKKDVLKLLHKVSLGKDITNHLSNEVLTKGYTTKENIQEKNNRWLDKDQLLNTKGFHHLHLKSGKSNKENIVLFAKVSRNTFEAIALFDHSVFDSKLKVMTQERKRMLDISKHLISKEIIQDSSDMLLPTTLSGHPIHIHSMTQQYWRLIEQVDNKLDCRVFLEELYSNIDRPIPKKAKLVWFINGLDLGVIETKTNLFFIFKYGHI